MVVWHYRCRIIPQINCQPQAVDSLVGKFIQIFFGVIINVIGKLVNEKRRTIGRTEKTAGDTVLHKWFSAAIFRHDGFAFGRAYQIFNKINTSAYTVGVSGSQNGFIRISFNFKFYSWSNRTSNRGYWKSLFYSCFRKTKSTSCKICG